MNLPKPDRAPNEPDVWGTPADPADPSRNADPDDHDGAHDHPAPTP